MAIRLVRVDERLIHGQIIAGWLPHLNVSGILLVSSRIAADPVERVMIESLATSSGIRVTIETPPGFRDKYRDGAYDAEDWILIFPSLQEVKRVFDLGVVLGEISIGNIHFCESRSRLTDTVYLGNDEIDIVKFLKSCGASVSIKCMPTDRGRDL